MNSAAIRANKRKLTALAVLILLCAAGYLFVGVNFGNQKMFQYSMSMRVPKLVVMLATAFAIGGASIVFQSIINNVIVTPCLLGMISVFPDSHSSGICGWFWQRSCHKRKPRFCGGSGAHGDDCNGDL